MGFQEWLQKEGSIDPEVANEMKKMARQSSISELDSSFFDEDDDTILADDTKFEDDIIFGDSKNPVYKPGQSVKSSRIRTTDNFGEPEDDNELVISDQATREFDSEEADGPGVSIKSDAGGMSISPSAVDSEYRTDHKPKSEYRTKFNKKPRATIQRVGLKMGEIVTEEDGSQWTVTEKGDTGTVRVRNRDTGEEKEFDEAFLIEESRKTAQGESNNDAHIKVPSPKEDEEEGEGDADVVVEKEMGPGDSGGVPEDVDAEVSVGGGLYEDFIINTLTDPELAPVILEKILRELENNEELLARIESAIPGGQMETPEYWTKNSGGITRAVISVVSEMTSKQVKNVFGDMKKKSVVPRKAELSITLSDDQINSMLEKEGYDLEDDTTWVNIENVLDSIINRWVSTASKKRMRKKSAIDNDIALSFFKAVADDYANMIESEWKEDDENNFYESVEELVETYQYNSIKEALEYFGEQIMDQLNDVLHKRGLLK